MKRARIISTITCILLIFLFISLIQAKMEFNYKCEGEGATVSTYSYLREPRIEEDGFERGFKSGSFNYLQNGKVDLEEKISYYYGNGTKKSNSTVKHDLMVEFDGQRGISEFFGSGFFGNDRFISAWKKIRYDESPNFRVNGNKWENRSSSYINVKASVNMKTIKGTDFNFNYHADVKDGVIEAKDSAGWTNRTGARKYDYEYHSLSSGEQLNITNNLRDSEPFEVAAGSIGEWLPCCYGGTVPAIDQNNTGWPTNRVIATLRADTLLPTRSLSTIPSDDSQTYRKREIQIGLVSLLTSEPLQKVSSSSLSSVPVTANISSSPSETSQASRSSSSLTTDLQKSGANCVGGICPENSYVSKKQDTLTCKERTCDGYECIYTYDNEPTFFGAASSGVIIPEDTNRDIGVNLDAFEPANSRTTHIFDLNVPENATYELYRIEVRNSGDVQIDGIILSAVLAKGMFFMNSSYSDAGRGKLVAKVDPQVFNKNLETNVRWDLGSLAPEETKTVIMALYMKPDVIASNVAVTVIGTAMDGTRLTDSKGTANVMPDCAYFDPDAEGNYTIPLTKEEVMAGLHPDAKQICPSWVQRISPR
jgi:uncharacterized repeat protein (TIGR01451 family)